MLFRNVHRNLAPASRTVTMVAHQFFLSGEPPAAAKTLDVDASTTFQDLQSMVASHFAIMEPSGMHCVDCHGDFAEGCLANMIPKKSVS